MIRDVLPKGVLKVQTPEQHRVVRTALNGFDEVTFPDGSPLPDPADVGLPYNIEGRLAQKILNRMHDFSSMSDIPADYGEKWPNMDELQLVFAGASQFIKKQTQPQ